MAALRLNSWSPWSMLSDRKRRSKAICIGRKDDMEARRQDIADAIAKSIAAKA
jgi:hypothetical protein